MDGQLGQRSRLDSAAARGRPARRRARHRRPALSRHRGLSGSASSAPRASRSCPRRRCNWPSPASRRPGRTSGSSPVHSADAGEWAVGATPEHGLYPLMRAIALHPQVALFTSPDNNPARLARALITAGYGDDDRVRLSVASRLLLPDEACSPTCRQPTAADGLSRSEHRAGRARARSARPRSSASKTSNTSSARRKKA
jgi:hypothetical protein